MAQIPFELSIQHPTLQASSEPSQYFVYLLYHARRSYLSILEVDNGINRDGSNCPLLNNNPKSYLI